MNEPARKQEEYWDERLARSFTPAGSGMLAYGTAFNWWRYQVCRIRLRQVVGQLGLALRDGEVLDIGCGTGFYLREWQRLGARHVTGLDIAPTAISRLRIRFPGCSFVRADIGHAENPLPPSRFLAISAFSVLFHIVDDVRYRSALRNIHAALAPGGYLVLSDNFVHAPRPAWGDYHVCRTLKAIEEALDQTGFSVLERVPYSVLYDDPVDSSSWWLRQYWRGLSWCVTRSNVVGGCVGAVLFPLELLLTGLLRESPTAEIMVCRKR